MSYKTRQIREERFKPWQYTDFYHVETFVGSFVVSMSNASHVERRLESCSDLEWIEFYDLSGTRQRVQARHITRVTAYGDR